MKGRVAIVSGGTGALGQSVSSRFLSAGATVCVPYVVPAELEALKARVGAAAGARLHCIHADVTDEAAFAAFVRGVLPAMTAAASGRIVNISSRAVVPPMGGFTAYTVAKAAIITLTQALAREVARGITVNAVLPSTMDTPANRQAMPDADRSQWVSTDAVAEVIAYLASDAAAVVSGATIPV